MTIEEKARAYDEALNWMRKLYPGLHGATKEDAEHYFPELRENEDERIRRELIEYLREAYGRGNAPEECAKWIVWLDQPKEQKPIKIEVYEIGKGTTVCGQDYKCKKDFKEGNCWYVKDVIYHCSKDGYLNDQNGVSWSCTPEWFNEHIYTNNEWADKEKNDFVSGQFLQCKLSFDGLKKGEHYWLEYIGDDMYVGRSDNILNWKFHITPKQLYTLFSQQLEEKQKEQKPVHTAKEMWEEMRLEVYAQASGNRHEPNYSDDSTKMFSLCDIDEIFEKIGDSTVGSQPVEWSENYQKENIQTRFAFYTYKDDPSTLYLSNVFVEETSRNHGFGIRILRAAEKVAETVGATTISLKVKQDSPANAWYRKHGYGYVAFEDGYDWLEKNLEYMKPNHNTLSIEQQLEAAIKQQAEAAMIAIRGEKPSKSQEWSEDDEDNLKAIIRIIEDNDSDWKELTDWLKSLPERFNLQPKQEWSTEWKAYSGIESLLTDLKTKL